MPIRKLDKLFHPSSIALIGASKTPNSVGAVLARNLLNSGFDGPVMPVHPEHRAVQGVLAYRDVASLPLTPDLAVVATPPDTVPEILRELSERGAHAAAIITAGFAEAGKKGEEQQHELQDIASGGMRILGPNCLGFLVPGISLNASFAHLSAREGGLAFVAQSGAIVTGVLDWAAERDLGFSHLVSLGNMADVDFGDMLDYLALEPECQAILLYIENVADARTFLSAARVAARSKPVVVIKGGRQEAGAEAASSHTGAMAGSSAVYEAAFRRAGLLEVKRVDELFAAAETLGASVPVSGKRLVILTNGGGFGVLGADSLVEQGGELAELSPELLEKLDGVLPAAWSRGNPVDIVGDAPPDRYGQALKILLEATSDDAILVLHAPTAVTSSTETARSVAEIVSGTDRSVLSSWIGGGTVVEGRRILSEHGIPTYATPDEAIGAFLHLTTYRRNQELLRGTPPSLPEGFSPDREEVSQIVKNALEAGREWLDQAEAKAVLAAYEIPVVKTRSASNPEDAEDLARKMEGPFALKVLSPDIVHKADVGGVALGLREPGDVRRAAERMLQQVQEVKPEASVEGFTLEPMASLEGAFELIVGMVEDAKFGPTILFGQGGGVVEVVDDKALALPPLNMKLARNLVEETRIYRQLRGYRDRAPVDLDAVALTLVKVSQLVTDVAEIAELDVNPLLASPEGVLAVDARVRVQRSRRGAANRLAVHPYPQELEEEVQVEGQEALLRPIRPEDEPAFRDLFDRLSPEQVRHRFFGGKARMPHELAARLTQVDYAREIALVLSEPGLAGQAAIHGVVRLAGDPDGVAAEFAVVVDPSMTNEGLGTFLVDRILDVARSRGIERVYGTVLRDNEVMRKLCVSSGFTEEKNPEDPQTLRVVKNL